MRKVLFVATVVRLHINVFHVPYLKWFHEQGWQVDVAAHNDYDDPADCVIPYCDHFYDLPFARSPLKKSNLTAYRQLKNLLDTEHYDIIHCHTPVGGVAARLAADGARKRGETRVLYTAHGFHFYKGAPLKNWLLFYPVERALAHKTDVLFTMNREDYQRAQSFKAETVRYVDGVGLDLRRFEPMAPEEKARVRETLGLHSDDIFSITVGNLIPRKNQVTLVRAVARLANPHFHLFICGDGAQEAALCTEARRLGVEAQVHFLGFRRDVYRLCGAADLFLFASVQEGLPVAVEEAMACGLPIIASRIRGNTDLIDEGRGGYLVPPRDEDGFADAIRAVLAHPDALARMEAYNLQKVQRYGIDAVLDEMAEVYRSVMEG